MTLKIHVIVDHYSDYFKETGKNFRLTNGEHHEAIHHTVKEFESKKNLHMKKKIGKPYSPGKMFNFNFQFQCAEGWVYHSKGYEVEKKEAVFHFLLPLQPCLKSKEKLSCQFKKVICKPFPL